MVDRVDWGEFPQPLSVLERLTVGHSPDTDPTTSPPQLAAPQWALDEEELGPTDDFLSSFKGLGWYLDDSVLVPIDKLARAERIAACRAAQADLAARIAAYKPEAIVTLLLSINDIVEGAAVSARSRVPRYAVPFPGMGQQVRFLTEMKALIPVLPRSM